MPTESTISRDATAAHGSARRDLLRRLALPVAAGAIVFLLNNFLLARLLTSLPGGTLLAATNMAALAIVVPRLRAFGGVVLLYATYGLLGTLGHLGVDAGAYVLHLPQVLGAALAFDLVLLLGDFRRWALALGVLPFAGILLLEGLVSARGWPTGLALAYAGVAAGMLVRASPGRREH